jgi:hypothetical protein
MYGATTPLSARSRRAENLLKTVSWIWIIEVASNNFPVD